MTGDPRIDGYEAASGPEAMLRFGPDDGPVVIAALPLFEEANRTRAFMVTILRALAVRGIGSVLPDVPGQGESLVPLEALGTRDMQHGYAVAVEQATASRTGYSLGVRSGALLDARSPLAGRWHLTPQTGAVLLRDLARIRQVETGKRPVGDRWWADDVNGKTDSIATIAGNRVSEQLLTDLRVEEPFDRPGPARRIVRLASDPAPADRKVEGAPLWLRSEPGNDPVLAGVLADDIADWIVACEG